MIDPARFGNPLATSAQDLLSLIPWPCQSSLRLRLKGRHLPPEAQQGQSQQPGAEEEQ